MISKTISKTAIMAFALLVCGTMAFAGPRPDEKAEANKKVVLEYYRVVFQAHNVDAAPAYISTDYIEHNPQIPSSLTGWQGFFRELWKASPNKPVLPMLEPPIKPEIIVAEGDMVSGMWRVPRPDADNPAKMHDTFLFGIFRVKDGKILEHWDSVFVAQKATDVVK